MVHKIPLAMRCKTPCYTYILYHSIGSHVSTALLALDQPYLHWIMHRRKGRGLFMQGACMATGIAGGLMIDLLMLLRIPHLMEIALCIIGLPMIYYTLTRAITSYIMFLLALAL